jgi:Flp pilus assembly protein TadG
MAQRIGGQARSAQSPLRALAVHQTHSQPKRSETMIQRLLHIAKSRAGVAAVEFAFVAPILLLLTVGMAEFGIALNNYIEVTEGVRVGARQLALSRGSSCPYTDTVNAVTTAASNLAAPTVSTCPGSAASCTTTTQLCITMSVNGTACTSDSSCSSDLTSGGSSGASGDPATVMATYPCSLVIMGHNFLSNCQLSSTTTEMIE